MPLAELDQSFAEKFVVYLKHTKGIAGTTISVEIKSLKHIIKKAFNDGQIEKNPFAYYCYFADQPEIEYLTEEEINKLITGKVKQQRQDRTRDMFLFCCFTGLSYADLAKLTYDKLKQTPDGEWWITSVRQKTKVPFTVKLLPVAKAILEKYRIEENRHNPLFPNNPGKVFPVASLKSSDTCLKHIARQCGISKNLKFHSAPHASCDWLTPLEAEHRTGKLKHHWSRKAVIRKSYVNSYQDNIFWPQSLSLIINHC